MKKISVSNISPGDIFGWDDRCGNMGERLFCLWNVVCCSTNYGVQCNIGFTIMYSMMSKSNMIMCDMSWPGNAEVTLYETG